MWGDIILYKIKSIYHNIKNGVRNIIRWFPTIWNDRNFDYTSIYWILYIKLKNMEEFFKSDNCWSSCKERQAKELNIAKNLCKRLAENEYLENATFWHDQKYESRTFDEMFKPHPDKKGWKIYVDDKNKKRTESFERCCNHSNYMRKRDKRYLFKYIEKNIENWWD